MKRLEIERKELKSIKTEQIERNFTYQAPSATQVVIYNELREAAKNFALLISGMTPESREQSLALTKVEEAVMWANASVARGAK
jgi:hypothetical protein